MNRVAKIIIFFFTIIFLSLLKLETAIPESGPENSLESAVVYDAEGLKDPFKPPEIKKEAQLPAKVSKQQEPKIVTPPSLIIQGIVWGGSLPQAIINQKIVKIGDTLEGARIIDIKKDGVTIAFQDQQFSFPAPAVNKNLNIPKEKQNPIGGRI